VVICLERGADCLHMVQLMPLHPKAHHLGWLHPLPKSKLVLPFRCRLTQVVLEKRRLNGCSVVVVTSSTTVHLHLFTPPCPIAHAYLKLSARLLVEVLFGTGTQLWRTRRCRRPSPPSAFTFGMDNCSNCSVLRPKRKTGCIGMGMCCEKMMMGEEMHGV